MVRLRRFKSQTNAQGSYVCVPFDVDTGVIPRTLVRKTKTFFSRKEKQNAQ